MPELLGFILSEGSDAVFYRIKNSDGKQWLIPARNTKTALHIYQPGGRKGKLLKRFFPLLKNGPFIQKFLGIEQEHFALRLDLKNWLEHYFPNERLEFSIFCGTPSVHQKITLQLSSGNKLLGYCKFTNRGEVVTLFNHEQQILHELHQKGIDNIPHCLYSGPLTKEVHVFLQTTVKTNQSKMIHRWNIHLWNFLEKLHIHTRQILPYEETDFYKLLQKLTGRLKQLPEREATVLQKALQKIEQTYSGREVNFSAYHADFTPWNMFLENGQLFVFDFEYTMRTCPPYLDYFHFFTQTRIFEKHYNGTQLYKVYSQQKKRLHAYFENPDFSYLCYLLLITAIYVNREEEGTEIKIPALNIWISMIEKLTGTPCTKN